MSVCIVYLTITHKIIYGTLHVQYIRKIKQEDNIEKHFQSDDKKKSVIMTANMEKKLL